jgi:hypothetical protein
MKYTNYTKYVQTVGNEMNLFCNHDHRSIELCTYSLKSNRFERSELPPKSQFLFIRVKVQIDCSEHLQLETAVLQRGQE